MLDLQKFETLRHGFLSDTSDQQLVLREITLDDWQDIFAIYSCPEVVRYYDCNAYENIQQALDLVQSWARVLEKLGFQNEGALREWGYFKGRFLPRTEKHTEPMIPRK